MRYCNNVECEHGKKYHSSRFGCKKLYCHCEGFVE